MEYQLRFVLTYCHTLVDRARRDERGMTTTEVAVITFLLVGAAIVVLGIIYNAAKGNADNIPVPNRPGG